MGGTSSRYGGHGPPGPPEATVLVKSQAIPSKILNKLVHLVLDRPTGLLPFALASKACVGSLS